MKSLTKPMHERLVRLRLIGKSIPEISAETGVARTTVLRHVQKVEVPSEFKELLRQKQGGAKARALGLRANIAKQTATYIGDINDRDLFFLLTGLYWGEGTKNDFSIINSDPCLISTFIQCLKSLNIGRDRISISLRVHSDISIPKAKKFWSSLVGVETSDIARVEVIDGRKKGKLKYGMCRVRVKTGIQDRLVVQGAIEYIGTKYGKR